MSVEHHAEHEEARERPAVREGVIAGVMAGFVAFVVVAAVGLFFFYTAFARNTSFVKVEEFPAPRLQTLTDGLREPQIAEQQADLHRFRWIDRAQGVFQIPIERAMRMVAARGAKAYDPIQPPNARAAAQADGAIR